MEKHVTCKAMIYNYVLCWLLLEDYWVFQNIMHEGTICGGR